MKVPEVLNAMKLGVSGGMLVSAMLSGSFVGKIPSYPFLTFLLSMIAVFPCGFLCRNASELALSVIIAIISSFLLTILVVLSPILAGYLEEGSLIYFVTSLKWLLSQEILVVPSIAIGMISGFSLS